MDTKTPSGQRALRTRVAAIGAVFFVGFYATYWIRSTPPHDFQGEMIGRDFGNFWMGARAVLSGNIGWLFDNRDYIRQVTATIGARPHEFWSYPPVLLLFVWPFGFLPYLPAYGLWCVAGFAVCLSAAAGVDRTRSTLLFAAFTPAVAINLVCGQNGLFFAALLILVFRFWDRRPLVAGLCLGVMLCKPQLVLLFPLALALSGRWRCFAAAGVNVLVLAGLTALVFGIESWTAYVRDILPVQNALLNYGTGFPAMMPTGFMNARLLGATPTAAWMTQVPFSLLAMGAVIRTFWRRRDPLWSFAVLLVACFVFTPYVFAYDMVVVGWLIAMLLPRMATGLDRSVAIAVWALPVAILAFGALHLPVAAPLMAFFLVRLVQQTCGDTTIPASAQPA